MEQSVITRKTGSCAQSVSCFYLRCAAEVIERTKSNDCVRVYYCQDAHDEQHQSDSLPSESITNRLQDGPLSPSISTIEMSDRATRRKEKKLRKKQQRAQLKKERAQPLSVRVTSTQFLHSTLERNATNQSIVHVKPLIVLDLNGILCHRVRNTPQSTARTVFRPSCGNIASTDIIPRSDLVEFLTLLHKNFSLAVWTSASRKTSKLLVDALFPTHISQRLVFIWNRSSCKLVKKNESETSSANKTFGNCSDCSEGSSEGRQRSTKRRRVRSCCTTDDSDAMDRDTTKHESENGAVTNATIFNDDVTAVKSLGQVWTAFPLWDATNTILLDDSPEKCPSQFRANSLHPFPIRGTITARRRDDSYCVSDDDEENQAKQRNFFQLFAKKWEHPTEERLSEFLAEHANDHNMRWKTDI